MDSDADYKVWILLGLKMGMGQNLVPLVNIKIAGKWMFIPLKMVLIGIDPYPNVSKNMVLSENLGTPPKIHWLRTSCPFKNSYFLEIFGDIP